MLNDSKIKIGISLKTTNSSEEIKKSLQTENTIVEYFEASRKYIHGDKNNINISPKQLAKQFFDSYDALVIPGNNDNIDPRFYQDKLFSEDPDSSRTPQNRRTLLEIALVNEAITRPAPILGICGGTQVLTIALGGTLHDISKLATDLDKLFAVTFNKDSQIAMLMYPPAANEKENKKIFKQHPTDITSNQFSFHQEAADLTPAPISISARDGRGVIKAIEILGHPWAIGTQFHPEFSYLENLEQKDEHKKGSENLFNQFILAAKSIKEIKNNKCHLHNELMVTELFNDLKNRIKNFESAGLTLFSKMAFFPSFIKNQTPDGITKIQAILSDFSKKRIHFTIALKRIYDVLVIKKNEYQGKLERTHTLSQFYKDMFDKIDKIYALPHIQLKQ